MRDAPVCAPRRLPRRGRRLAVEPGSTRGRSRSAGIS